MPAWAQGAPGEIKIGVLNDRSGYQTDLAGKCSAIAARLAAEDFGGTVAERKIVLTAGMQNKPDMRPASPTTSGRARRWPCRISPRHAAKSPSTCPRPPPTLTRARCSPTGLGELRHLLGRHLHREGRRAAGRQKLVLFTADYTFCKMLQAQTSKVVDAAGGTVVGAALHAIRTSDFSS